MSRKLLSPRPPSSIQPLYVTPVEGSFDFQRE
ncbi:rCG26423, isoform CRA_a [Rattus norvegicus]|uniref:RCG26423, isoform CRA_a n=1 Tax=Rattus norvegicus TaxID=10116 RepID=A6HM78_RAT|nr:rCG26423, isoform CRA_a [Rattus norvegicus]